MTRKDIGSKIMDNGWIDFQKHHNWKKPILDFYEGESITFKTSNLKDLFKNFIDPQKTYFFQGIKINPEVNQILNKFKKYNGKISRFKKKDDSHYQLWANLGLIETYFEVLEQELTKDNISFINYELADKENYSNVKGILSWPTIFVTQIENAPHLIKKANSINNYYTHLKEIERPQFNNLDKINLIHNENISPLILDEDTSFEVCGGLVQKMSNLLLTYKSKCGNSSDCADGNI